MNKPSRKRGRFLSGCVSWLAMAAGLGMATSALRGANVEPLLAERLADLSASSLESPVLATYHYRQAGLLLDAASRVSPDESRFHRLRHEAFLQAGDIDAAIDALVKYCRLETTDLQAQARLIELYAQRMETADAKVRYLRDDLLRTGTIPAEVRSHAAVLAARTLLERGERRAAVGMVNEAVRLNPVNVEAQQLRFELVSAEGMAIDRLNGLLAIVRAAPLRTAAVAAVAEELSLAGLGEASATWYDAALNQFLRSGTPPPPGFVVDFAARLLGNGQPREASALVGQVLGALPDFTAAHIVRVAADRAMTSQGMSVENVERNRALARTALTNAVNEVAIEAKVAGATTRPAATLEAFAVADPAAVAAAVHDRPELREEYVTAAGTLALFHLIFLNDASVARAVLPALGSLLPQDSPLLARIDGWAFLVEGRTVEARARLSAIADRDPLAALGLVRIDGDSTDPMLRQVAESHARRLRSQHTHGVTGSVVSAELAARRIPFLPSDIAVQLREVLGGFPARLLRLGTDAESFYVLRAEPLRAVVGYGEPLLVRVTLVNTSEFDLAIGDGSIRNDLWFDAVVRGLQPANFPGTAYDRLGGPLVLRPRQQSVRVARVDQGALQAYLRTTPLASVPVSGSVVTNPVSVGRIIPGPGGYAVEFSRIVEQTPVPVVRPESRAALLAGLRSGPARQRLGLIDAAVIYSVLLARPGPDGQTMLPADELEGLRNVVRGLVGDADESVRAYATVVVLRGSRDAQRQELARAAAADPSWLVRLGALVGLRESFRVGSPQDDLTPLRELALRLVDDTDATVSAYALAVREELDDLMVSDGR